MSKEVAFLILIRDKLQNGMSQVGTPSEFLEVMEMLDARIEELQQGEKGNG